MPGRPVGPAGNSPDGVDSRSPLGGDKLRGNDKSPSDLARLIVTRQTRGCAVRSAILLALLALSAPSALAQSPFDGTYAGVSRVSGTRGRDLAGRAGTHVGAGRPWVSSVPALFSVHNGIVRSKGWSGSVDPAGAISIQTRDGDRVAGTISGDTIHADYQGTGCSVSFV